MEATMTFQELAMLTQLVESGTALDTRVMVCDLSEGVYRAERRSGLQGWRCGRVDHASGGGAEKENENMRASDTSLPTPRDEQSDASEPAAAVESFECGAHSAADVERMSAAGVCLFCGNRKATASDVARFDAGRWEAMRRNEMRYGFTEFEEARHICWQDDACETARLTDAEMRADADTLRAQLVEMRARYDRLACELEGVRKLWLTRSSAGT
jgi:hypothetical protein